MRFGSSSSDVYTIFTVALQENPRTPTAFSPHSCSPTVKSVLHVADSDRLFQRGDGIRAGGDELLCDVAFEAGGTIARMSQPRMR